MGLGRQDVGGLADAGGGVASGGGGGGGCGGGVVVLVGLLPVGVAVVDHGDEAEAEQDLQNAQRRLADADGAHVGADGDAVHGLNHVDRISGFH